MLHETPIKLIIFDNDGTLMNTEWVYSVAHKICTGYDIEWDFKVNLMGKTPIEACRLTCEHYHLTESPESLCERRTKIVDQYWPTIPLMPGAQALVDELKKRGIKLSIATASNRPGFTLKSSGHKDFVAMMDVTVCGDEVEHGKPAPDLFLAALAKFPGIKPEEALVFEDSPLGIKAANLAGMPSVFVPDEHLDIEKSLADQQAVPTYIIDSLEHFDFNKFKWA
ncbi:haloacid dehalogenase-like hydrolase family protein [Trichomonas vaginalis G3]|uniref:Haloacid dehalogenase-like hydrolase family protein n=1 Tax=Trichomonas vaginalis (strain ATCC PRA-98 / G3) TaxID=412133 RepID=A2E3S6_TRIV3|nr:pseudouridine 5'-phosphatase protein [Trichomonas vaginalis G3]EAY12714.1 haloacid dehalogenase-like hydrolase family protein [Trichomonas vaginalis G3]KAI5517524.1 pseudouridine 5'-phosphatase protein [Trichomonas vaginalis G3]|eukprot:XP_001324937.1 haloacid dehalogenase-like hydrolase family protein [Trichomonas vaginalis G3]